RSLFLLHRRRGLRRKISLAAHASQRRVRLGGRLGQRASRGSCAGAGGSNRRRYRSDPALCWSLELQGHPDRRRGDQEPAGGRRPLRASRFDPETCEGGGHRLEMDTCLVSRPHQNLLPENNMRWFKRLIVAAVLSISAVAATVGASYGQDKVVRIGYQKYGKFVLLKGRGTLEDKLKPLGYSVAWTEFPSGPPLLEALNVGSIDFGIAGETPPIFAQAAGAPLVYLAYDPPAPQGEAILVPKDSPLKSVADLRGK